jgi:hypothetical protein
MTAPYPECPRFPFVAPSKLTLWNPGGGGSHLEGLRDI